VLIAFVSAVTTRLAERFIYTKQQEEAGDFLLKMECSFVLILFPRVVPSSVCVCVCVCVDVRREDANRIGRTVFRTLGSWVRIPLGSG
jgi:hypothetical protein